MGKTHVVSVVVIDAETVGRVDEQQDPDGSLRILRLCAAIRCFQNHGLHVIVVSKKDIRDQLENIAKSQMDIDMGHFLCMKAFNPGFIDTLWLAVEYEAFYVSAADVQNIIENDWRIPPRERVFFKTNPGLHVQFIYDHDDKFQPFFYPGVIPGDFAIPVFEPLSESKEKEKVTSSAKIKPKNQSQAKSGNDSSAPDLPSGWISDDASPELAVLAVDCDGIPRPIVAIFGLDEKDPLLQSASLLCSSFSLGEVEYMKDWQYQVRAPWKDLKGGGNLPHIVYAKPKDGQNPELWAIGVSSRKKTRQRAAKLALFVADRALSVLSGAALGTGADEKVLSLVERAIRLIPLAMAKSADGSFLAERDAPQTDESSPAKGQASEDSPERVQVPQLPQLPQVPQVPEPNCSSQGLDEPVKSEPSNAAEWLGFKAP